MEWYARFNADWDASRQSYRSKKLVEAAQAFGVEAKAAHDALADSVMTLGIIQGMANCIPF
jgi:exonuclease I